VVCKRCRYAYYGRAGSGKKPYVYYRCSGTDPGRFGGQRVCDNKPLATAALDQAVWDDVRSLLADPARIEEELNRRLGREQESEKHSSDQLQSQIARINRCIGRLVDAYGNELLDKSDFETRIKSARAQLSQLQGQLQSQADQEARARELRGVVDNLQMFSRQVLSGLDHADWETKQKLIRTLVKRIEIDKETVNVVYRVDISPFDLSPKRGICHYCRRRESAAPDSSPAEQTQESEAALSLAPA
jgi:site-specific DNA recombinase